MPSLSPRENYLRCLRHEDYEYVPFFAFGAGGDMGVAGFFPPEVGDASTGFVDGFGVRWTASDSTAGALIPEPGKFILTDITRWKKDVAIPDVDKYDWDKISSGGGLFPVDRDRVAFEIFATCGPWERLVALMGFEGAMIAMMEEPEAAFELLTAVTDYKIALAKKTKKYYNADTFIHFDDIATERNLFMSPETYRRLIKPQHIRINKAVEELGMIPIQHTCGHAELCVEDYIETGAAAWHAVQPTNDLAAILDKYGDRFCLEGGFDTNGKPGRTDATVEEIKAEVERCFQEYGKKKGFIFMALLVARAGEEAGAKNQAIVDTANRIRFAGK